MDIIEIINTIAAITTIYNSIIKNLNIIIESHISNNYFKTFFKTLLNKIILTINPNDFLYLSEDNKKLLALVYLQTYIENNEIHLSNDINTVTSGKLFEFISNMNISKRHFYIDSLMTRTDVKYFNVKISKSFKISLEKYIYINKFYLEMLINKR